jgi:hypothetical protein
VTVDRTFASTSGRDQHHPHPGCRPDRRLVTWTGDAAIPGGACAPYHLLGAHHHPGHRIIQLKPHAAPGVVTARQFDQDARPTFTDDPRPIQRLAITAAGDAGPIITSTLMSWPGPPARRPLDGITQRDLPPAPLNRPGKRAAPETLVQLERIDGQRPCSAARCQADCASAGRVPGPAALARPSAAGGPAIGGGKGRRTGRRIY